MEFCSTVVKRQCERPDSDLDLIVVQAGDREMEISHSWIHQGIVMCMTYVGDERLKEMLSTKPHWFWPFSQAEILCDAMRMAQRHHSVAQAYFVANPHMAEFWKQQTTKYWEQKKASKEEVKAMSLVELIEALDKQISSQSKG